MAQRRDFALKKEHDTNGYPLGETRFTWDGLRLLQEHRHQQTSLYFYEDEGYEPLARVDGTGPLQKIRYYHNDLNGLPEQLTEADGHNVWQATYRVWGNTLEEVREPYYIEEQNLRFQGQYLDRETGLHFNTFRFYDPDVGRFTTPDPIGLAGGGNLYQYAPNPIGWMDPWGWACSATQRRQNKTNGKAAENLVHQKLLKNPNVTVLGTQVYVKTPSAGRGRYVDILIKNNKTGKIVAIEVKSGGAIRSKAQLAKDKIIADGKGIFKQSGKSTKGVTVSEARVPLWRLP